MNNNDFISKVAKTAEISKKDAKYVIETAIAVLTDALADGEKVKLANLGKFEVVPTPERTARNIRTGEPIAIPASKKVKVSLSSVLKNAVKNA